MRLYWVRCPEEVARARCRQRNIRLAGDYFIDDEAFDRLRARFEPLEPDESFEVIDTAALQDDEHRRRLPQERGATRRAPR